MIIAFNVNEAVSLKEKGVVQQLLVCMCVNAGEQRVSQVFPYAICQISLHPTLTFPHIQEQCRHLTLNQCFPSKMLI